MLKFKPNPNFVALCAVIAGLVLMIGCGSSTGKKQLTEFVQEFGKAVEEYTTADDAQKTELKAKIESYMQKWSQLKLDMGESLTPQAFNELEVEYQKYVAEFEKLSGKS